MLLNEKNRREEIQRAQKQREEYLRLAAEAAKENKRRYEQGRIDTINAREDRQRAQIAFAQKHEQLIRERKSLPLTPTEQAEYDLKIANLEKQAKLLDKQIQVAGQPAQMTPYQEEQIKISKAEQDRKNLAADFSHSQEVQKDLASVASSYMNKDGKMVDIPFEEQKANAERLNFKSTSPIYYKVVPEVVTEFFDGKSDQPGYVIPIRLPRNPQTGRQYTMGDVIRVAQENNMTPEAVLKRWRVLK